MKRCNNCGWFNHDSAVYCEKCEDTSFEIEDISAESIAEPVAEPEQAVASEQAPIDEPVVNPQNQSPMTATVAFSASQNPVQPVPEKHRAMAATVMDASSFVPISDAPVVPEVPAVPEVSDAPADPASCPKCCYPVSGDVDYCPNCGATIKRPTPLGTQLEALSGKKTVICAVREEVAPTVVEEMVTEQEEQNPFSPAQTVPISAGKALNLQQVSENLKATVADVSLSFISEDDESDCSRLIPVDALGEADIVLRPGEIVVIHGQKFKFEK